MNTSERSTEKIEIFFQGPQPLLVRFISALQSEGLVVEDAPLETRSAEPITDAARYWLHVGLDGVGPLASELARKATDLGQAAVILEIARRCRAKFMDRFKDNEPGMHIHVEDEPWL